MSHPLPLLLTADVSYLVTRFASVLFMENNWYFKHNAISRGYRIYIVLRAAGSLCIFVGGSNMRAMSLATLRVLWSSMLALFHLGPVWTTYTWTVCLWTGETGTTGTYSGKSCFLFARRRWIAAYSTVKRRKSSSRAPRGDFSPLIKDLWSANPINSACVVLLLTSSSPAAQTKLLSCYVFLLFFFCSGRTTRSTFSTMCWQSR